jgi:hypothetical protein
MRGGRTTKHTTANAATDSPDPPENYVELGERMSNVSAVL